MLPERVITIPRKCPFYYLDITAVRIVLKAMFLETLVNSLLNYGKIDKRENVECFSKIQWLSELRVGTVLS